MNQMRQNKAFTLIELLVVIAVIALLMAILIPALSAAKKQAQASVCMANQRGLITAYIAYALDNDDRLPNADTFPPGSNSGDAASAWAKAPILANGDYEGHAGVNVTEEDRFRGIMAGVLFPYIKDVKLYHCPADNRHIRGTIVDQEAKTTPAYTMYRSYGIQGGLNGEERDWSGFAVKKLSDIKSPGTTYVFVEEYYDGWGSNYNGGSWQLCRRESKHPSWWNVMAIWHVNSYTLSFADGHVSKIKCRDKRTLDYSRDRWNTPDHQPDNPDLEFMVDGYAVPLPRKSSGS